MVRFEDKDYEARYMSMMKKVVSGLGTAIKAGRKLGLPRYPSKPQDIPEYFEGVDLKQPDAILGALWLSKENKLLPINTPLRQVWYTFAKLTLQKLKTQRMHPVSAFYSNLKDLIENSDLMYADFNILNPPDKFQLSTNRNHFPNVLIGLEKKSYYDFFTTFANLIGVHLFAAGGQPAYSGTEEIARQLAEITGQSRPTGKFDQWDNEIMTEIKYLPDLNIVAVADYDPSGLNIGNAIAEQFESHMGRRYETSVKGYRATPTLDDYTDTELEKASYNVKGTTVDQKLWQEDAPARAAKGFVDERFKDIGIYDDTPKSWMMQFLAGGDQKMKAKKAKEWINKWRDRIAKDPNDFPHMFGLEVESLPREPLERQLPEGFVWNDQGQARAKLLTFEKLESIFPDGVKDGFKEWLRRNFRDATYRYRAESLVEYESGIEDFDNEINNITALQDIIRKIKVNLLKDDIDNLNSKIEDWKSDEYTEIIDKDANFDTYRNELIKAIANDEPRYIFREIISSKLIPRVPADILDEVEVSDDVKDKISENVDILKSRVKGLCETIKEELPDGWEDLDWNEKYDLGLNEIEEKCPDISKRESHTEDD